LIQPPKRRGTLFICILVVGLLAGGCRRQAGPDVLAEVNGYKVERSEVDKTFNRLTAGLPEKLTSSQEQAARLKIIHQIIEQQLQLHRAEKLGIAATDEEVTTKFNQAKAPYTNEEFAKKLHEVGMTEDEYKQELRRGLTIDKMLNHEVTSKITISDADIQAYYNQHTAEFNVPEPQYRLAHIFVSNQAGPETAQIPGKAQNAAEAQQKIQQAYARLRSGEDFAAVAGRYSEDPESAKKGGDLGSTAESRLKETDAATREAVLKLQPGQFTSPIPVVNPQTHQQVGYRIVRLIGKDAAGQRDLNDPNVQQWIRSKLRSEREQLLRAAFGDSLYDGADIHNYYANSLLGASPANK
jgi:peptidyl-prolyl cis-trans isomerase SurA